MFEASVCTLESEKNFQVGIEDDVFGVVADRTTNAIFPLEEDLRFKGTTVLGGHSESQSDSCQICAPS